MTEWRVPGANNRIWEEAGASNRIWEEAGASNRIWEEAGANNRIWAGQNDLVDIKEIATRWAETWQRGWPDKDIEALSAFYSPEASYLSVPFRQPDRGVDGVRGYLRREFGVESQIECRFRTPVVEGNRAAIEWWASWIEDGVELTMAGSTFLRFDDEGEIVDHRDYWNQTPGRFPPYLGWDRS